MKFKKLLAGVCAMSIAASMMAVSASAAITEGDEMYDITAKFAELDGYLGDITAKDIAGVKLTLTGDGFNYYEKEDGTLTATIDEEGFGGGIMLNSSVGGWDQHDDTGSWGNDGKANSVVVTVDGDTATYTMIVMFDDVGYKVLDDKDVFGEVVGTNDDGTDANGYAQIVVQEWWGGDLSIEYTLLDADGNDLLAPAEKAKREAEAAAALKELQDAYADLNVDEVVAGAEAAAEALGNTTAAVNNVTAAIQKVNGLKDILAKAQAAFDALKEGDVADTAAFEKAKADVEKAAADLDAAKKELDDAIAAYDKETAEEKAKLEQQIADLEAEKAKLEAELEAAKKDAAANADKIKDLEAQIAAKDKEIEELKKNPPAASGSDNSGTGSQGGSDGGSQGSTSKGDNPGTGATAGLALAGLALAGAAVVASKKRK